MVLSRPTLRELIDRTDADLAGRLGLGGLLRRGPLAAISRVLAGLSHGWHGLVDWVYRQAFVDTADADALQHHATLWGISRRPAVAAAGPVTFNGSEGSTVGVGVRVQRSDGVQYVVEAEGTIDQTGTVTLAVVALEPGAAGNATVGTALSLVVPVPGVQSGAAVAAGGITDGADEEDDESLRARILLRIRNPPMGGRGSDYVQWALEVPGVTRCWVRDNWTGYGTVGVWIVTDDEADPIPSAEKLAEVAAYIDDLRPVTARVSVLAPVAHPVDVTLHVEPDTEAVRAAVEESLADLIRRRSEPGATLRLSHVHEAISTSLGETDHTLTAPAADVVLLSSELATLGVVTWF